MTLSGNVKNNATGLIKTLTNPKNKTVASAE